MRLKGLTPVCACVYVYEANSQIGVSPAHRVDAPEPGALPQSICLSVGEI